MSLPIYRHKHQLAWLLSFLVAGILVCLNVVPTYGESTAAISQGFKTDEADIAAGALISLKAGSQNYVELSNTERANQLIGVLGDKPLVELSNNTQEVQVVIGGTSQVLVSDINGDIKIGDRITPSPINGVGMRANTSSLVVGTAQVDLTNTNSTAKTIKDKNGKDQKVNIGSVPAQINVTYYAVPEDKNAFMPPFLQAIANTVAGKDVSPIRVLVSLLILIFGFAGIAVLLYSSIRSSIISIGRNPLSEGAVRKSLFEVGATSLGILLVMLITIYLILTV